MAVNISYMGTKKELAPSVAAVIRQTQRGVMLDASAGMGTVGEEVAPARQVWSNDVQLFAAEVGRALFSSHDEPPGTLQAADEHFNDFELHRLRLASKCSVTLKAEDCLLESVSFSAFSRRKVFLSKALVVEAGKLRNRSGNLFTRTYAGNYFGIHQAIEADSILHALALNHSQGRITDDQKRWLTIALGRALLKIANSTGHFAQFLKPKRTSYKRYLRQRRRSLWTEWLFSTGELRAVGTVDWRRRNRSFHEDSVGLLPKFVKAKERPSVIYADPPYTDDQYSRYYHLLDTLMLYDYPVVTGAGLYRPGRFQASFSIKSKAVAAFDSLVRNASRTGADLVLSYPSNGLIHEVGVDPKEILAKHFRSVECCYSLPHSHSTFGASKGSAHADVTELIYLAKS
jgi:adenine-specific DNA-methyltransferase